MLDGSAAAGGGLADGPSGVWVAQPASARATTAAAASVRCGPKPFMQGPPRSRQIASGSPTSAGAGEAARLRQSDLALTRLKAAHLSLARSCSFPVTTRNQFIRKKPAVALTAPNLAAACGA